MWLTIRARRSGAQRLCHKTSVRQVRTTNCFEGRFSQRHLDAAFRLPALNSAAERKPCHYAREVKPEPVSQNIEPIQKRPGHQWRVLSQVLQGERKSMQADVEAAAGLENTAHLA